ncbi:MAG: right-handed parallel beta-helix repeat-containing protein, partial [Deltaproteobacteria bacterium]|nr:right-handed parallel beta-helix repeat-containing protein [Deltaproteobacteria bacterium]
MERPSIQLFPMVLCILCAMMAGCTLFHDFDQYRETADTGPDSSTTPTDTLQTDGTADSESHDTSSTTSTTAEVTDTDSNVDSNLSTDTSSETNLPDSDDGTDTALDTATIHDTSSDTGSDTAPADTADTSVDTFSDTGTIDTDITDTFTDTSSATETDPSDSDPVDSEPGDSDSSTNDSDTSPATTCDLRVAFDSLTVAPNGASWNLAYKHIQDAIDAAQSLMTSNGSISYCNIWIKAGTYHIYQSSSADTPTIPEGIRLLGGFAGSESNADARLPNTRLTIVSGNSDNDQSLLSNVTVTVSEGVQTSQLDGIHVESGQTGISITDANLTINNCTISHNTSSGILMTNSSPTINDTAFFHNIGVKGGGLHLVNSSPVCNNCLFVSNHASDEEDATLNAFGGAVFISSGTPTFERCAFFDNAANDEGGAVHVSLGSPHFDKSVFVSNVALQGGAIWGTNATFTDCVFIDNSADSGGVVLATGDMSFANCTAALNHSVQYVFLTETTSASFTVVNSILFGNSNSDIEPDHTVSFSIVQSGYSGTGNLVSDPLFDTTYDSAGAISMVAHDEGAFTSTLTDNSLTMAQNALVGQYLQTTNGSDAHWRIIQSNTENSFVVTRLPFGFTPNSWSLHSFKLSSNSPAIDSGIGSDNDFTVTMSDVGNNSRINV